MELKVFSSRVNAEIYKEGDLFWVCDARQNPDNPHQFSRKLKPVRVVYMGIDEKNEEHYFVRACKDGRPSKSKVSLNGPSLYQEPFKIFETQDDCESYYSKALKEVYMGINSHFDEYKAKCAKTLGEILEELKEMESYGK